MYHLSRFDMVTPEAKFETVMLCQMAETACSEVVSALADMDNNQNFDYL